MDGARGIDLSMLTGSRMINLDSEEEGIFLTRQALASLGMALSARPPSISARPTGTVLDSL